MDYFYKLENHGLYSALNLLLWVYAKNFKKRKHRHRKLLIDDSNSQYFKCKRFDYYFNFCKVIEDHTSATKINNFNLRHGNHLLCKNEINRVLEYTPLIKEKIGKRMSSLNLPDKYSSIHVRSGDKVSGKFKESEIIEEEEYIKHLNIKCNNLNLFVMSDDFLVLSKITILPFIFLPLFEKKFRNIAYYFSIILFESGRNCQNAFFTTFQDFLRFFDIFFEILEKHRICEIFYENLQKF